MTRTTARALTVVATLAVAGAVAGAGTLTSSNVANPAVSAAAYTVRVTPAADDAAALAARTQARATFAERASRDAAVRSAAHLKALRVAKAKAAHAKKVKARKARKAAAARHRVARLTTTPVTPGSARAIGKRMAASRGWTGSQWAALDRLWAAESGWSVSAGNGYGAYGIPQALPGSKMAGCGANWRTSAATQIDWGLDYIAGRWGTPMSAWSHFQYARWY